MFFMDCSPLPQVPHHWALVAIYWTPLDQMVINLLLQDKLVHQEWTIPVLPDVGWQLISALFHKGSGEGLLTIVQQHLENYKWSASVSSNFLCQPNCESNL